MVWGAFCPMKGHPIPYTLPPYPAYECHQPSLKPPTSLVSPALEMCPSHLSRLCFFPVFFFFSLRIGEELSQLQGGKWCPWGGTPNPIPVTQGSPIPTTHQHVTSLHNP